MIFTSDNWAGAAPEISQALSDNAQGMVSAYGTSDLDDRVRQNFNEIFEREVSVFFVGTGTVANSLALASMNKPGGILMCHREAHIIEDECGAPEFFTSGGRLLAIDGDDGKMDIDVLAGEMKRVHEIFVHHGQPMGISMTQTTEAGTIYSPDETARIADIAHGVDVPLHMDGARFANAMVQLNATPAEMTWKQGVDVLSFGGTKNGCWCAEALIFFDPKLAEQMPYLQKRAGQLYSKSRFITAQFEAYFKNDLWVELATYSNGMADHLRAGIAASNRIRAAWDGQANEVFAIMQAEDAEKLQQAGAHFYEWPTPHKLASSLSDNEKMYRFVTSFATKKADIDQLLSTLVDL
ncbi:MAG: low specificity L-threonine aldolase [Hyphomicrobiales bacterium]|nr:MAG: low specificity L-threonine aldolase [Hyphomicrobiales bacterium]